MLATSVAVGWILIMAGLIISFIAVIIFIFRSAGRREGRFRGGALIMLGPIPIIFGTDKESVKILIILSAILIIIMLAFIIAMSFLISS